MKSEIKLKDTGGAEKEENIVDLLDAENTETNDTKTNENKASFQVSHTNMFVRAVVTH